MFSDPQKNIAQARFALGSAIADFGAGSGHYVKALSVAVGEKGTVFAVDVQKDLLTRIKKDSIHAKQKNVEIVWGDLETPKGTKLREGVLDGVVISNLLFQVPKKEAIAEEAKRVLKTGGTVLIIDWADSISSIGPKKDLMFEKVKSQTLFEKQGFLFEREIDAGNHHYGIILRKV